VGFIASNAGRREKTVLGKTRLEVHPCCAPRGEQSASGSGETCKDARRDEVGITRQKRRGWKGRT